MISRRALLKSTGALLVPFSLTACKAENNVSNSNSSAGNSAVGDMNHGIGNMGHTSVGNWLKISADGSVQLSLGKVELGQGIGTALAQLAAEALDVNFSRISITAVDTDYSPDQAYTFSSISVQQSGPAIEKAASAARRWMAQLAAKTLAVEIEELSVSDGEFYLNSEKTEFSYWQLVDGQNTTLTLEKYLAQRVTCKMCGSIICCMLAL